MPDRKQTKFSQYQYLGIFVPTTIPMAGPEWIPIRTSTCLFGMYANRIAADAPITSKAIKTDSKACLSPIKFYTKNKGQL